MCLGVEVRVVWCVECVVVSATSVLRCGRGFSWG